MKNILKRGLSLFLTLIMVVGLLPVTAFAKVDESTGIPLNLDDDLVLSIYTGTDFPGEPALHSTSGYVSFNSSFKISSQKYANTAENDLNWEMIQPALVEGAHNNGTTVWGVYDANGTDRYFNQEKSKIIQDSSEQTMIKNVFARDSSKRNLDPKDYEIVWYIIKLQHTPRSGWNPATTEWHIDGIIKKKDRASINYYGNGNTSGGAPSGTSNHDPSTNYTVADNTGSNRLQRVVNNVNVAFLGWNTKADGSGKTYLPGAQITPQDFEDNDNVISLYAMWDSYIQHTATVNTLLDGVKTDDSTIHGSDRQLALGDGSKYYDLTADGNGTYTAQINGNGTFNLYIKDANGSYSKVGNRQLTIYNQNGSLDVHHYSVTYNANGGGFSADPGKQAYNYGDAVTAVKAEPIKEGYRFLGWEDSNGNLIQPGAEVTASINAPVVLTAKWEQTVTVTVNVTIDHTEDGGGYDKVDERTDVSLALVSKTDADAPYLETGDTLELSNQENDDKDKITETKYTHTFENVPASAGYTVVTSKSDYDVTKVEAKQDKNNDWTIDVVLKYKPTNFDLAFAVEVDKDFVEEEYYPDAAIVKVTFWSNEEKWEIITQQEDNLPGVRVDLENGKGTGSYPVWKYESAGKTPYGYRVVVTSFVYPDGTIVPVNDKDQVEKWTDDVYTAAINDVTGGKAYGVHDGAYYSDNTEKQAGTLKIVIDRNKYNVTFDAQEGKIKDVDTYKEANQYVIPNLESYVPTREGYTFGGWYEDVDCTIDATEGMNLTENITLYAKWIAQLTIQGEVKILGTYKQNGETVEVHDIDRATEAVVVLQEIRDGKFYEVDSQNVTIDYRTDKNGYGTYSFTGILDDGKSYQIHVLELNYSTAYDNESDTDNKFTEKECTAYFGDDTTAVVNAELTFVPPSYGQPLKVDATAISENFRPTSVLSEVMYRDVGDIHPFKRISQHDVEPYGVGIILNKGKGEGEQSVWKWHTDGTLYDYQMNITKFYGNVEGVFSREGTPFDSDNAPFYIEYSEPAHWNEDTEKISGDLVATLIPNEYRIIFDLNADTDPVTGMDAYRTTEVDAEGDSQVIYVYDNHHKWSYETAFTVAPQREGYTFKGWETSASGVASDADGNVKIAAAVHQEVTLTARWEKNNYTVTTVSDPENSGATTGNGTYVYGEQATVKATAQTGYNFCGWYEGESLVSEAAAYTFTVTSNRDLTARFAKNPYNVEANATTGGTTVGTGIYEYGQTATVTATPADGYAFRGWYEGTQKVSEDASYSFTVTADRALTAQFSKVYTITVIAETGGSVSGGGVYEPMANATITAEASGGYYFVGWYDEEDKLVVAETSYQLSVKEDRTFTAKFEKKVSYKCDYVYLFGYTDSEIGATGPLLRGELAQMIYRLVKQNDKSVTNGGHSFSDTAGEWFESGISYMTKMGAIDGSKTNAYPYVTVTRGETYKMICLGLGFTSDTELSFSEYATILRNSGYLFDDGRVTAKISRWEFCKLFNAILGRSNYCRDGFFDTKGNEVTADTYGYTDLKPSDSYYGIMMIATSTFTNGKINLEKRIERNTYDYTN